MLNEYFTETSDMKSKWKPIKHSTLHCGIASHAFKISQEFKDDIDTPY